MLAENRAIFSAEFDVEYRGGDLETINRCDGIRDRAGGHDMRARCRQRFGDLKCHQRFILDHEDDTSIQSLVFHSVPQPQCSTLEKGYDR
jgi:hypothetical protein